MAGKKWCQYCRINLPYTKKDIQDHEATRQHLQNKQKAISFERMKIRKQRQQKKKNQHQVMLGTANIPKAKKGSQLQQQIQSYRDSVINQGKSAIHRLIAQRTKGMFGAPIQYPDKQDLVLAQNYQDQNNKLQSDDQQQTYQMWKIDICDKTGDPCFINRVTKLVLYEPPKGYVLSQEQKQQWEYLKQICKDKVDINPDQVVNITEWEEMPDEENYFEVNKARDSQQEQFDNNNGKQEQNQHQQSVNINKYLAAKKQQQLKQQPGQNPQASAIKTWRQDLQQKLINNQISTNQVFQKFLQNQMKNSKTMKQKNDNLKKLIESGIQIRTRPTDQLLLQNNLIQPNGECKIQQKPKVGFKARKKIKTNAQLLSKEKDIF